MTATIPPETPVETTAPFTPEQLGDPVHGGDPFARIEASIAGEDQRHAPYDPAPYVRRGAALLDRVRPDWVEFIPDDLDLLDMARPRACVLGWIYGDYTAGRLALFGDVAGWDNQPHFCGFNIHRPTPFNPQPFGALTQAWRDLITERRRVPLLSECRAI